jgi:tRNA(Ile)-lysidine synthase
VSPEIARHSMSTSDKPRPGGPNALAAKLRAVLGGWAALHPPSAVTVAFSGGLDSTVLLATLCGLDFPARIRAAHVDHGLHPRSGEWSAQCARTAAALGVELSSVRVAVDRASGEGLEAAARAARYRALGELLSPGEWLLTAHHADDQLETLLLRMLRGTGVRGLRGIIAFGPFGPGWLGRPLLDVTREELRAEAASRQLVWLEDPSNAEPRQDRNYLRLAVVPALRARWPAAAHHAERLAEQASDAERLLEAVARDDANVLAEAWHVPRAALAALEPARQRNLLRYLLRTLGLGAPGARTIERLREALLESHAESRTRVRWPGGEGRVYREALYLLAPLPPPSPRGHAARIAADAPWTGPEGRVELTPAHAGPGLAQSWIERGLTLRFRGGGERFRPHGREHHHSLKHLFQEAGVVPWMRERVPLLYRGDELAAIGDLWISAAAGDALAKEPRWCVRWTRDSSLRAPEPGGRI